MLTKITTILSDEGLNVENLTNKSRRDFAYTMVDINGVITDDIVAKLRAIEGVIRVNIFH